MNIKSLLGACLLAGGSAFAQTLLWADNFDTTDGSLDTSSTAGRLSGLAAGETALQSFAQVQNIFDKQLSFTGFGGVRFGPELNRYNWAGATTGPAILAAGGFTISFGWTGFDSLSTDWMALKLGTPNNDTAVNASSVDYTFLIRENGGNEVWLSGVNFGDTGIAFTPVSDVPIPVSFTFLLDSFEAGSLVTVIGTVNGVEIVNGFFELTREDELRMEFQADNPMLVKDLSITTVPEPGTAAMLALAGAGFLVVRRRLTRSH